MKKLYTLLLVLFLITTTYSQIKIILDYPCKSCDTIIHSNHIVSFSKYYNIPALVEYNLYPDTSNKLHNYKFHFIEDEKYNYNLKESLSKYYKKSGFDRGHLFPAEDASYSKLSFMESYYETNMIPQYPSFNRGIWKKLETKIRKLSKKDTIDILTGPDLHNEYLERINNKIGIPKYFFKIVINYSKSSIDIYYIPNSNNKNENSINKYLISVDELNIKCGIILNKEFISKFKYVKYADKKY